KLLMCADFRRECLKSLPSNILQKIHLPEIDREYTLYEVAAAMSAGPARALGLTKKGSLGIGCDADVVIYDEDDDVERMFGHPRYVIKAGEIVIEEGDIRETPQGREYLCRPPIAPDIEDFLRPRFEDCYTMSFENYPVELDRIEHVEMHDC
ncbi:MAG: amidohydrolase family protein, partial [Planctomycetaceae bacterium]|nr:amidohydrolase family protein [Planctomycetaceae bacterium]